jgi:glycosyltransferase involved in cell wall biosynthesis
MKLLMYSHAFAPAVGGVETHVMHLARGLALLGREKVQLTVVTKSRGNGYDDSALPFRVVRRPGILQLAMLIRQSDLIHLAGPVLTPQLLCAFLRKPTVVEHHGYQVICPNGMLLKEPEKTVCPGHYMRGEYRTCLKCYASAVGWGASLKALLLTGPRRRMSKRATANICITQHVAERVQLPRTSIVYYGVPDRENSNDPAGLIQFAYVGRFVAEKGVPILVEAAGILQSEGINFDLLLIGDGPQRNAIEQQVERLGLGAKVQFTGFLEGKELDQAVAGVSAVVMPSICEETAGLSAIEQMMRGRPVVVSDIGGLAEVTGDGGLKFPPGDAKALAKCLARLAEDPGLRADLGGLARKRAATLFSMQRTVEDHLKVYENALGRSK